MFPNEIQPGKLWSLQHHCRDPNAVDGYIDTPNSDKKVPFEFLYLSFIEHDQANPISDDLWQQLGLQCPKCYCWVLLQVYTSAHQLHHMLTSEKIKLESMHRTNVNNQTQWVWFRLGMALAYDGSIIPRRYKYVIGANIMLTTICAHTITT